MDNRIKYFGRIVKILDDYEVVINKGASDGILSSSSFLILEVGEEIIDPETKESLGFLEITKGWCKPKHIQEKVCTLRSSEYDKAPDVTEIKKTSGISLIGAYGPSVTEVTRPGEANLMLLNHPKVGDMVIVRGLGQR